MKLDQYMCTVGALSDLPDDMIEHIAKETMKLSEADMRRAKRLG